MEQRILEIIERLIVLKQYELCTSIEISKQLKQSKNNTMMILNQLYHQGILIKIATKPNLFLNKQLLEKQYQTTLEQNEFDSLDQLLTMLKKQPVVQDFEKLIGHNDSLNNLVEKIQATVSYPPVGLPILLNGPTGTGKSFIARLTYEYCINQGLIDKDKQFVQVNCSEYANNPELLTANLFGYKKGAFTGADKENLGLLHYANGGVLFLDEVHCLKAECQEKLFLYMDQGIYHLVGDNDKWYKSNCRIIFATTEVPEKVLLKTLLRRIPVILNIPALGQRGINERLQLIYSLYDNERKRINKDIKISSNVYQLLLNYEFTGNIGELSNVVQSSCVNALFNQHGDTLEIHAYHLPEAMMETVNPASLMMKKHQMVSLEALLPASIQNKTIDFYDGLLELVNDSDFYLKVREKIDDYFEKIIYNKKDISQNNYILETVTQVFNMLTPRYGFKLSHNELIALTSYLLEYSNNTYKLAKWFKDKEEEIENFLNYLKIQYHREYLIGKEAFEYFKDNLNGAYDLMVHAMITLMVSKYLHHNTNNQSVAIILAHGYSTASSIAQSVNRLLDTYIYDAIDMPLNVDSQTIIKKINEHISYLGKIKKVYLLVDMGSLEEIYQGIEVKNIDIAMINNVNTRLALTIGDGIRQGLAMETIFKDINQDNPYNIHLELHHQKEPVILCSCASGMGAAQKLKDIIYDSLPKELNIKVITYDYPTLIERNSQDDFLSDYEVICVVGTLNPNIDEINFIGIEELIIGNGYEKLELYFKDYFGKEQLELFENNVLKNFSLSNVMNNITILNPNKLLEHVSKGIDKLQTLLNKRFKNKTCFGLYVHICCLIERLITQQPITVYNSEGFLNEHKDFIEVLKKALENVEYYYNVSIPNEEIEYIYEYVKND